MIAQNRKAAEYIPAEWIGRRLSETRIETVNKATGARLEFIVAFGRIFGCESDSSGNYYDMPAGHCCCPDAEHRAIDQGRMCRHMASWERVCWLLESEAQAEAFRAAAINPQQFDDRVIELQALTEELARQIEAEQHLVEGELLAA